MQATREGILEKLRKICLALPNATETVTFGNPTFQVAQKTFCVLEQYKGELSMCFKVGKQMQPVFLKDDRFFRTPYIGQHGWVSLRAGASKLKWDEIKSLADNSYKLVQQKRRSI